ncbi:MAG: HlyC/CorC family transporter [Gemmatimonadetes bacterium]|nr:HlyC/CorC family transporter [Gemmatimonadota bacterium]
MEPVSQAFIVLFLVALNGFFVAAEFAFVKVGSARLGILIEQGSRRARTAQHIQSHLDEYLSACQIGITIASLGLGWVGEPFIARYLRPLMHVAGFESEALIHAVAFSIAFLLITFLHIVLGEMAPKSFAIRRPLATSLNCAFPLRWFYVAAYPFIYALNGSANLALRLVGVRADESLSQAHSEEELRALLSHSEESGEITKEETTMLERVFEFHDREAHQILVPRPDIVYLLAESDPEENLKTAEQCGFTRFPLCVENIDHIIGFVHVKDLYRGARTATGNVSMQDLKREILFFPEHTTLDSILGAFQRSKVHLGIVLDEYGGTLGLVTLEDVIEELVGEIQDEFDREIPAVIPLGPNEFLLDGRCPVSLFVEKTGVALDEADVDTVAGIILRLKGGVPVAGDKFTLDEGTLVVERVGDQRIRRARYIRIPERQSAAN